MNQQKESQQNDQPSSNDIKLMQCQIPEVSRQINQQVDQSNANT